MKESITIELVEAAKAVVAAAWDDNAPVDEEIDLELLCKKIDALRDVLALWESG